MYLRINQFLLSHEDLNMSKVPGFFQFFYSADFQVSRLPPRPALTAPRTAACRLRGSGRRGHAGLRVGVGGVRGSSLGSLSAPRGAPVTVPSRVSG